MRVPWLYDSSKNQELSNIYYSSLMGELTLEKIAWEGEFTLRSDP